MIRVGLNEGGNGTVDSMIKVAGTNGVVAGDIVRANAAFPAAVHASAATTVHSAEAATTDHDLATTLHATASDHAFLS